MTGDGVKLHGVTKTMLFTLYCRALDNESRQPVLGDHYASEVLKTVYEHIPLKIKLATTERYIVTLRAKRFDGWAREYLAAHPDAVVLHLACGLDSRAFRIEVPDTVTWIDLDVPEVISLREGRYPSRPGYRAVAASATETDWLADLPHGRPLLMIAEGLLMYLPRSQVKALLHRLTGRFGEGQLLFDVVAPWVARLSFLSGYELHWGTDEPREIEKWNPRLSLMDDAPVFSDHAQVPLSRYRIPYHLLSTVPVLRDAFRPLRFRF